MFDQQMNSPPNGSTRVWTASSDGSNASLLLGSNMTSTNGKLGSR